MLAARTFQLRRVTLATMTSGGMYCSPGSRPMVEAAVAWSERAACLNQEVAQWRLVTSKLTTAAVQAATPYIIWLDAAATAAAHAADQAASAAYAHDLVRGATVPPEAIKANRTNFALLAMTNFLAQASPTIADIDAEYQQMWARDADTACADASAPNPPNSSPSAVKPAGLTQHGFAGRRPSWDMESASDVTSSCHQVMAAVPKVLQGLLSSPPTHLNDYLSAATTSLSRVEPLSARPDRATSNLDYLSRAAVLEKTTRLIFSLRNGNHGDVTCSAGVGLANSVGMMSVPQRWAMKATVGQASAQVWGSTGISGNAPSPHQTI